MKYLENHIYKVKIVILMLFIVGCENKPAEQDLIESDPLLKKFRESHQKFEEFIKNNESYQYTTIDPFYLETSYDAVPPNGYYHTTIKVENSVVVERENKIVPYKNSSLSDTFMESNEFFEENANIGKNKVGSDAVIFDDIYRNCEELIIKNIQKKIKNKSTNESVNMGFGSEDSANFFVDNNGILSSCYLKIDCREIADCWQGPAATYKLEIQ